MTWLRIKSSTKEMETNGAITGNVWFKSFSFRTTGIHSQSHTHTKRERESIHCTQTEWHVYLSGLIICAMCAMCDDCCVYVKTVAHVFVPLCVSYRLCDLPLYIRRRRMNEWMNERGRASLHPLQARAHTYKPHICYLFVDRCSSHIWTLIILSIHFVVICRFTYTTCVCVCECVCSREIFFIFYRK